MTESLMSIKTYLESNQLLGTLVGGGIIVTVFRYIKDIWDWILKQTLNIISFEIVDRFKLDYDVPETLKKMMWVINTKSKVLWMKQVELMKVLNDDNDNRFSTSPHGTSYRLMYGKFITVNKEYEHDSMKPMTRITIRVYFCSKKKFLTRFLNDLTNAQVRESNDHINIEIMGCFETEKVKRPISSIYSNNNSPQLLLEDAKRFLANEELYKKSEVPYKRNYLLYGKPGTGKSSTVLALASELDWNVLCIDANKNRIDDIIRQTVAARNTIFLFEDIDAVCKNLGSRKAKKINNRFSEYYGEPLGEISLSQLLNLTDGLATPYRSITIFTTNHIEDLDEALLRDGRMDMKLEFENFNAVTANRMINDKLGFSIDNIKDNISPATLQESIMKVLTGIKTREEFKNEWSR